MPYHTDFDQIAHRSLLYKFERHITMLSTLGAKGNGYLVYHYDMEDLFNLLKKCQERLRDYKSAVPTDNQPPSFDPVDLFDYEVRELRQHIAMCRNGLLHLDMKVEHGPRNVPS